MNMVKIIYPQIDADFHRWGNRVTRSILHLASWVVTSITEPRNRILYSGSLSPHSA